MFDTHAHLFKEYYTDEEINKIASSFKGNIIVSGTDNNSNKEILELKYDNIYLGGFMKNITNFIYPEKIWKNIRIYLDKSGYFDKIYVSAIKYRYLTVDAQYTTGGRLGFRLCLV